MKEKLKRNYKLIVGIVIGVIVSLGSTYATTTITSSDISYDNSTSGLTSTNMKGAIDELYEKTEDIRKRGNFVSAYTYNQTDGASNFCVTGGEETCEKTNCYKNKTADSCKAGDIIKYKVNDADDIITFHVMFDNGETMTIQSQRNIIGDTVWDEDYLVSGTNDVVRPLKVLSTLEKETEGWSNVNNQTYTMGTTSLSGKGAYTGCSAYNSCTSNSYTLPERTAKARMITVQETVALGCTETSQSCPIWMYNYLEGSISSGGTVNDSSAGNGYWTISGQSGAGAWYIYRTGALFPNFVLDSHGARAVVVVSK